jgi:ankyrin repeat protein
MRNTESNRLEVLKLLIAAGADVSVARDDGAIPLHFAAERGHADVVLVLIETTGVDLNAALLAGGVLAGMTPVFIAAQNNQLEVVTLLTAAGADVNIARVNDGATPLHAVAHNGHADIVDLLITAGANVNAIRTDGATALSTALAQGHAEVVQKLRAAGAN